MAAKSPKTYSDLRFKFLRGLLAHEKYQRQRHYLKQASEWTSKAIVSLDLSPHPIKSVPQAAKLEGIGAETAKKLKEYLSESTLSSAPPPPGLYLTSASAILVAMSRCRELQRDTGVEGTGRIKKQDIKARAQDTCQERFLDMGARDLEAENTELSNFTTTEDPDHQESINNTLASLLRQYQLNDAWMWRHVRRPGEHSPPFGCHKCLDNYNQFLVIYKKLEKISVHVRMMCVICQEDLDKESGAAAMPCMHVFHQRCLRRWRQTTQAQTKTTTCAICRGDVNSVLELRDFDRDPVFAINN